MKKLMVMVVLVIVTITATQAQSIKIIQIPGPEEYSLDVTSPEGSLNQVPKIILNGSQKDVSYQLLKVDLQKNTAVPVGKPVKGTGKPIIFDTHSTSGESLYTIGATTKEGCGPVMMKDSIVIKVRITAAKYDSKILPDLIKHSPCYYPTVQGVESDATSKTSPWMPLIVMVILITCLIGGDYLLLTWRRHRDKQKEISK